MKIDELHEDIGGEQILLISFKIFQTMMASQAHRIKFPSSITYAPRGSFPTKWVTLMTMK